MDKIKRLRDKMEEQKVDLIVLAPGANLNWLIGVNPHADERPLFFSNPFRFCFSDART